MAGRRGIHARAAPARGVIIRSAFNGMDSLSGPSAHAALGVRSCPVSDPAADTERGSQVSVWVPLYGLVDGRQIAALMFVILPSGADRHQQVQARLDHGPGRFERLPSLEFRGLTSATRSSPRCSARGRRGREQSTDRHVDERANLVLGHIVVEQLAG